MNGHHARFWKGDDSILEGEEGIIPTESNVEARLKTGPRWRMMIEPAVTNSPP